MKKMILSKKDIGPLLLWVLLAEGAGLLGSLFTAPAIATWYAGLVKPALAPPNWIFGPVWTTLFLLMGVAAFLVWRTRAPQRRRALGLFFLQLFLNVAWSFVFFGSRDPRGAFFEIILLWLSIAAAVWAFSKVSRAAAWLLVPYIAWVSFAGYLNYLLWMLNS
jgi:tryptophan-rich sensory protein